MMRFAIATVLALTLGSQADAQLIRRFARPAYYSNTYSYTPYYNSPGVYYGTNGVVTSGYYTTPTYSYVYPAGYNSYSNYGYNTGYSNYGYNTGYRYSNYYGGGRYWRRGWRW